MKFFFMLCAFSLVLSPLFAAITVESISGEALFSDGGTYRPLQKGQQLKEGVRISTGAQSRVVLNMDGHTLTIHPLSFVKVFKNIIKKDESTNSIGLKYGSLNAKVKKIAQVRTNFLISTPVATSSVRGTEQKVSFGPAFGMKIVVPEGKVVVISNGENKKISGKLVFSKKNGEPRGDNLAGNLKGKFISFLTSGNLTSEEKDLLHLYGDQLIDSGQTPLDILDNAGGAGKASVNLIWNVKLME